MLFRPRYSLLTLLILTALVAGGVKLWYGPHHVVEQTKPDQEDEYTYTRGWRGEKIVHGPHVARYHYMQYKPVQVRLTYNRQGVVVPLAYYFLPYANSTQPYPLVPENNQLTPAEQEEFRRAIDRERQRLHEQGVKGSFPEGYDPNPSPCIYAPKTGTPAAIP